VTADQAHCVESDYPNPRAKSAVQSLRGYYALTVPESGMRSDLNLLSLLLLLVLWLMRRIGGGGISNYSAPTTTNITTLQTSDMILRSGDISESLDQGCRDGSMMTSRPRDSLSVAVQQVQKYF
jgi:hypothetical protein